MTLNYMHCDRRSGQRKMPRDKQHVNTGQRKLQGLKEPETEWSSKYYLMRSLSRKPREALRRSTLPNAVDLWS